MKRVIVILALSILIVMPLFAQDPPTARSTVAHRLSTRGGTDLTFQLSCANAHRSTPLLFEAPQLISSTKPIECAKRN